MNNGTKMHTQINRPWVSSIDPVHMDLITKIRNKGIGMLLEQDESTKAGAWAARQITETMLEAASRVTAGMTQAKINEHLQNVYDALLILEASLAKKH